MSLTGLKILVVEDDPDLRDLLANFFVLEGAIARQAQNGQIAFEMIGQEPFDFIVTDVRMPGGDGITLIKQTMASFPSPPKIFVCSGFNDLTKAQFLALGAVDVFVKPFSVESLVGTLARAMTKK